jgi:hypothetical protein
MLQRCPDPLPHDPHEVAARGTWTGFTCAGQPGPDETERQLTEAFGPE